MSEFLEKIRALIGTGEVLISEHGYDEMSEDGIKAREVLAGVTDAELIEEYLNYPKGPCVLLLQKDRAGKPIHVVWVFQGDLINPLFWLPHTGRIPSYGTRSFYRGEIYETTQKDKIHP